MRFRDAVFLTGSSTLFSSIQARLEAGGVDRRICSPAVRALQYPVCEVYALSTESGRNAKRCGGCGWYTIHDGDTCGQLSTNYGITLSEILFLNPEINADCTNLQHGASICLFYRGAARESCTPPITVIQGTSSQREVRHPLAGDQAGSGCTLQQLPLAPGTLTGCALYLDASDDRTGGINITEYPDLAEYYNPNLCRRMADAYSVHITDLLDWNPSLPAYNPDAEFQPGHSYCMQKTRPKDWRPYDDGGHPCLHYDPDEIVEGTDPDCVCYTAVTGWDRDAYETGVDWCEIIADDFLLSVPQLKRWNPWLEVDCSNALYAGLEDNDQRAVCVGVDPAAPLHTALNKPVRTSEPKFW